MALVRILVDGYSLIHAWPDLARGRPRHGASAREALLDVLRRYRDAIGTPLTVVFDGGGAPARTATHPASREFEVLFSRDGKTADDVIERAAHRLMRHGEVLVVTDDAAERETVLSFGGHAMNCAGFIHEVRAALHELSSDVAWLNRRERQRYHASRSRR